MYPNCPDIDWDVPVGPMCVCVCVGGGVDTPLIICDMTQTQYQTNDFARIFIMAMGVSVLASSGHRL